MMMAPSIEYSREPFAKALGELMRKHEYTDSMGNPNLHAFAAEVEVSYESLRRTIAGERVVTPRLMEECAAVFGIPPQYFAEYRIYEAHRAFDVREVGFDQALENFDRWAADAASSSSKARRKRA